MHFDHAGRTTTRGVPGLLFGADFAAVTTSTSARVADAVRQGRIGASIGVLHTHMDVGQTLGPLIASFTIMHACHPTALTALAAVLVPSAAPFMRSFAHA